MAKLDPIRERVDAVFTVQVPEHGRGVVAPNLWPDHSMILTEIIVAPFGAEPEPDELLRVLVGDHYAVQMPLRMFVDSYRAAIRGGERKQMLDYIMRRAVVDLEALDNVASASGPALETLSDLAKALRAASSATDLGIVLVRSVLVAPRMNLAVDTTGPSTPTVWLRGLVSRPVP